MAKRRRKLEPADFSARGLIMYARSCGTLAPALSADYCELADGRRVVSVRSEGLAIRTFEVVGSRMRRVNLPAEFW